MYVHFSKNAAFAGKRTFRGKIFITSRVQFLDNAS